MNFGLVLGKTGGRIKSRDGGTPKLMGLLEEAKVRAKEQLMERFNAQGGEKAIPEEQKASDGPKPEGQHE